MGKAKSGHTAVVRDIMSKHKYVKYALMRDNVSEEEIIISFAQDGNFRSTIPYIKIGGRGIAQVCHAKLLGVTISQDLTWNKHVETKHLFFQDWVTRRYLGVLIWI